MKSRRNRMKMIVDDDRISHLPDDLVAKILSFLSAKEAVETSVLSSRWRFVWTKIPHLNFLRKEFSTVRKFHKFFTHVLSSCNNQVEMSLNLNGKVNQVFVQKILNHACSRKLQQLLFSFSESSDIDFPLSLFSSQSLKHLSLIGFPGSNGITPTSMWELPTLTTLHLEGITLYDDNVGKCVDIFSKCTNLKNLTIKCCGIRGSNSFTICHTKLSNLTLENSWFLNDVNVVASRLKNLNIIGWDGEVRISTPDLTSILYKNRCLKLSLDVDSLPSLEKVGLYISYPNQASYGDRVDNARKFVDLLQKFSHVKFLTLSLEIIELLSASIEAIAHRPSPFMYLRSLKIHPELYEEPRKSKKKSSSLMMLYPEFYDELHKTKLTMSTEVKNYLLNTSPGATFIMVTREELRAVRDTKFTENLMAELRVLLDLEKARIKEDKRRQSSSKTEGQVHHCWENLYQEIMQVEKKSDDILSLLERIVGFLVKLPSSNKAELAPRFVCLFTEAKAITKKMQKLVKARFDTKESTASVSFHQPSAAAQSSS